MVATNINKKTLKTYKNRARGEEESKASAAGVAKAKKVAQAKKIKDRMKAMAIKEATKVEESKKRAEASKEEFHVQSVVRHKGLRTKTGEFKRNSFKALIKWTGYDSKGDATWEPFALLKDTIKFQEYCAKNQLSYLLGKK